ncbi:methyl-CpG-binding domain protein 2-like [Ptychodera flava]|uniref:methyl-CpG-binding domain protein 2-like n=1 Tax=Ptychodera flava TaxID=63121 RepID=UPI00396A5806
MERRKLEECPALPKGWKREEVIRKSGLSAGKTDVYYYSPSAKKFRSKPQLARYLGDTFDLSTFDFRTGKISAASVRKSKRLRNIHYDYSKGTRHDATLLLPIRQTASIFKQPVTSVSKHVDSKVRTDGKQDLTDQPKQLFWEKRLQGSKACDTTEEIFKTLELPEGLTGLGPGYTNESLLQSLATNLHLSTQPVTGQAASQVTIEKNPGVYLNTDQPLCPRFVVTDADIKKQEDKVRAARKKLESLMSEDVEVVIQDCATE